MKEFTKVLGVKSHGEWQTIFKWLRKKCIYAKRAEKNLCQNVKNW